MDPRLRYFYSLALQITGDEEAARIMTAVAAREGGLYGGVGDVRGGGSYGPLQFYAKGQLPHFARFLGTDPQSAARIAQDPKNWDKVIKFAWTGYLGGAIRTGKRQGLRGPALASHASRAGQRSVAPEKSGQRYTSMFGPGGQAPDFSMRAEPIAKEPFTLTPPPLMFTKPEPISEPPTIKVPPIKTEPRWAALISRLLPTRLMPGR